MHAPAAICPAHTINAGMPGSCGAMRLQFLRLLVALLAVVPGGTALRHLPRSMKQVHYDPEPLEFEFPSLRRPRVVRPPGDVDVRTKTVQAVGLAAAARSGGMVASYPENPKNGTPWFRYTQAGENSHEHFGGLSAHGDFDSDILGAHNVVRERAGLAPLAWSAALASLASERVRKLAEDGCYIRHSPLDYRWREAGFQYVGENLYKVINMVPTGVDIVDAWYVEVEDYTYGRVGDPCTRSRCASRRSPPCTLGHFTQVMWSETSDVGCARAECPHQAKRTFVAVCHYGPGGNIVGRLPFPARRTAEAIGLAGEACDGGSSAETIGLSGQAARSLAGYGGGSHPTLALVLAFCVARACCAGAS